MEEHTSNGPGTEWSELRSIFEQAFDLTNGSRRVFLDEACRDRPQLRERVEDLLANYDQARGFFSDLQQTIGRPMHDPDPLIGGRVGNYEILELLGEGGMGLVYKARHMALDQFAALKFLSPRLSSDSDARARLIQEARAAYALDHPNICTIYDVGETDEGRVFISMSYYEGETLRDKLRGGPLPGLEALEIVIQICRGLVRAHSAGTLHGDIKPSNIFITKSGVAKILDFGVAQIVSRASSPTPRGGTVAYMSPEQSRGEPLDPRTDIWSVGILLYELLTGRNPFRQPGDETHEVAQAIQERPWRNGTDSLARLPGEVADIIGRCLTKSPGGRYDSAEEIIVSLMDVGVPEDDGRKQISAGVSPRLVASLEDQPYLYREVDRRIASVLSTAGVTVTIKGGYQMGKSSLLRHAAVDITSKGRLAAVVDLRAFDRASLHSSERFFRTFAKSVSDALGSDDQVERYWRRPSSNPHRCSRYVSRHVLGSVDREVVLCLDEIEMLFDAPFRIDFFAMLRNWHNERASSAVWRKLSMVISTSTEPYELLQTPNLSPFNVGETIKMEDFSVEEVWSLAALFESSLSRSQAEALTRFVHGHPYLIRTALVQTSSGETSLDSLLNRSDHRYGPFADHLNYHLFGLVRRPEMMRGFREVLLGRGIDDEAVVSELLAAGLVRREGQAVAPRCPLYANYFRRQLLD